ncbi:unnamed protein product [Arctia plantaginis]|uniref:Saccharopine dehydrogenase NADP binding domain-containing protein n=1 Tax=Arctia plantaginis TaxID=874455 RepID=A0A8S0ZUA5_ARCPL|nr:unnamed protein product [Arctia plantaginis]
MKTRVDILVFGATGFTGKFTVRQLALLTKEKYLDITWGIAGRSKEKLENLVRDIRNTGLDIKNVPVIECDVDNEESLKNMTRVTKVVINCTGVNIILSPKIVKGCIETRTHYVDISSEIFHILSLYRSYNKPAKNANVLVIPSCGFSSIPIEAGMIHLDKKFKGTLHSVECYVEHFSPTSLPIEPLGHSGTWTSCVHVLLTLKESLSLKKEILPKSKEPKAEKIKRPFFFHNNGQLWFPWPGVENDTVQMSQQHLYEESGKKPIHFNAYTTFEKWYYFFIILGMYIYYYLCNFKCFAKLLINYPRVFTFGFISEKGPTNEMTQKLKFRFLLNGVGWEAGDQNCEPTKTMSVKVSGRDPYDSTAIAVIMSAITIIKESSNIPKGGVLMPGAAFHKTDLVDRLMNNGYTIEVLK